MLKWLSRVDDFVLGLFQRLSNWITRKKGMGAANRVLASLVLVFIYIVSALRENAIGGKYIALMFALGVGVWILLRSDGVPKEVTQHEVFRRYTKIARLISWIAPIRGVIIRGNYEILGAIGVVALFYLLCCHGLPPCKGELWEKIKGKLSIGQTARSESGA